MSARTDTPAGNEADPFAARPTSLGWLGMAAVLALGGLAAAWLSGLPAAWLGGLPASSPGGLPAAGLDAQRLDWQPGLAWAQPWRWWSGAWVHWSWGHLAANLAGTALIAALGVRAHADRADAWAWFAAWPLTQLGLLLQPALLHYGGLSGVLHGGVVIAAITLAQRESGLRRWVGCAILVGVALKVGLEQPWGRPLRHAPGWSIAIAPAAHLSGALSGLACGLAAAAWRRRTAGARPAHRGDRNR